MSFRRAVISIEKPDKFTKLHIHTHTLITKQLSRFPYTSVHGTRTSPVFCPANLLSFVDYKRTPQGVDGNRNPPRILHYVARGPWLFPLTLRFVVHPGHQSKPVNLPTREDPLAPASASNKKIVKRGIREREQSKGVDILVVSCTSLLLLSFVNERQTRHGVKSHRTGQTWCPAIWLV